VSAPVQYGPRITAIILYLYVGQFLSKQRTAQALAELFGTPVSEGTVAAMSERAAGGLDGFCETVREAIAASQVAGFDETGLRVAGGLHWVHCARTDDYTLITCHPKRSTAGIAAAGVLPRFKGVAVHDAWAPCDTYIDAAHQLCCAHALRELQAVGDTADPGSDWCWATQARDALVAMQRLVTEAVDAGADQVDPEALAEQVRLYRSAAQIGLTETAARSDNLTKNHNALAQRLLHRQDDYLRFTTDWRIPPDNNGSERDIRMIKLRQKDLRTGCRSHIHRRKTVLRHPKLPIHRRQTRTQALRNPGHARRGKALGTRSHLTSNDFGTGYGQTQQPRAAAESPRPGETPRSAGAVTWSGRTRPTPCCRRTPQAHSRSRTTGSGERSNDCVAAR
jgi:Transposase IS66 family